MSDGDAAVPLRFGAAQLPDLRDRDVRAYLTPQASLDGSIASAACREGAALSLAGGPLAFPHALVAWRSPGEVPARCVVDIDALRRWIDDGPGAPAASLLERLSAPRPPFAGLALDRPRLMGVVNVTPDSFSDGGLYHDAAAAIARGRALVADGADIVDIGGESTRPGAEPVPLAVELNRVLPVVTALRDCGIPLSIDSRNAAVMEQAFTAGARIVNDITALEGDPRSLGAVAALQAPVVLMHTRADPRTMQIDPTYVDVVCDVYDYLAARVAACEAAGIPRSRIVVDPGIGFGKTVAHNVALLRGLATFQGLGVGVLIGVSHKSFIARLSAGEPADRRLAGSLAAALAALRAGAQIVRAHEAFETRQAIAVFRRLALAAEGVP